MTLRAGWENLSPNAKRAAALGGGLLVVVAITAGSLLIACVFRMKLDTDST
jgi:conjugal transfer pilus assembly protein TraB